MLPKSCEGREDACTSLHRPLSPPDLWKSGSCPAAHQPTHLPWGVHWAWGDGGLFLQVSLRALVLRGLPSGPVRLTQQRADRLERRDLPWSLQAFLTGAGHTLNTPSASPIHLEAEQAWGWRYRQCRDHAPPVSLCLLSPHLEPRAGGLSPPSDSLPLSCRLLTAPAVTRASTQRARGSAGSGREVQGRQRALPGHPVKTQRLPSAGLEAGSWPERPQTSPRSRRGPSGHWASPRPRCTSRGRLAAGRTGSSSGHGPARLDKNFLTQRFPDQACVCVRGSTQPGRNSCHQQSPGGRRRRRGGSPPQRASLPLIPG